MEYMRGASAGSASNSASSGGAQLGYLVQQAQNVMLSAQRNSGAIMVELSTSFPQVVNTACPGIVRQFARWIIVLRVSFGMHKTGGTSLSHRILVMAIAICELVTNNASERWAFERTLAA